MARGEVELLLKQTEKNIEITFTSIVRSPTRKPRYIIPQYTEKDRKVLH